MRHSSLALSVFILSSVAAAHELDIAPVNIELRIEKDQVRARIDSAAATWLEEILRVPLTSPLPATNWPAAKQKVARDTVEKSFQLMMDGRPLSPGRFDCRFVQEPLAPSTSRVVFDISYPMAQVGRELSGRAQFFGDVRQALLHAKGSLDEHEVFLTKLSIIGGKSVQLDLPFDKPEFTVPLDGHLLTPLQKMQERAAQLLYRLASNAFFWIILIAVAYNGAMRFFKRRED